MCRTFEYLRVYSLGVTIKRIHIPKYPVLTHPADNILFRDCKPVRFSTPD